MERLKRVMVVEDDKSMMDLLSACLRSKKYQVVTADDGAKALELLARQPVDLIISDVSMPGMSGYELCRAVRGTAHRDIPFLFCSALSSLPARVEGLRVGADDYLVKPIASEELLLKVRVMLERADKLALAQRASHEAVPYAMRGSLRDVMVGELLQMVDLIGRSEVRLKFEAPGDVTGSIWISRREVIHAETGELTGERAFLRMLKWTEGTYRVEWTAYPADPTMHERVDWAVLRGMVYHDEHGRLRALMAGRGDRFFIKDTSNLLAEGIDENARIVLSYVRDFGTLDGVLNHSTIPSLDTVRALLLLLELGVVAIEGAPAALIAGKYRIDRVLGGGGMGIVVRATNVHLELPVALKFLRHEARARQEVIARFTQEGKALARLTTEHVARILDVGMLDDGAPYIVMEHLEGEDLEVILARRGPLPVEEVATYLLQACEALAEAHAARIVHRDLKPANLFLARQRDGAPIVKVLDFGIAKAIGDAGALTRTSSGLGSVNYMAPEQMVDAKNCDERADIWALGITLYELTTGALPFQGSLHDVYTAIVQQRRPSLCELLPGAPAALEAFVDRCLQRDPGLRPASVLEFAEGLVALAGGPEQRRSLAKVRHMLGLPNASQLPAPLSAAPIPIHEISTRAITMDPPAPGAALTLVDPPQPLPAPDAGVVVRAVGAESPLRAAVERELFEQEVRGLYEAGDHEGAAALALRGSSRSRGS